MQNRFHTLVSSREALLADGAMGTTLFTMELGTGDAPELLTIDYLKRLEVLRAAVIGVGSDILVANSVGVAHYPPVLHKAGHRVKEWRMSAAKKARVTVKTHDKREVIHSPATAGSMKPASDRLAPAGPSPRRRRRGQ